MNMRNNFKVELRKVLWLPALLLALVLTVAVPSDAIGADGAVTEAGAADVGPESTITPSPIIPKGPEGTLPIEDYSNGCHCNLGAPQSPNFAGPFMLLAAGLFFFTRRRR